MKNLRDKKILPLLLTCALLINCIAGLKLFDVKADETFNFNDILDKCASLTETDYLDGENFDITTFFNNTSNEYTHITDIEERTITLGEHLTKIIPIETILNEGDYQYVGKEYAFFIKNYIDGERPAISLMVLDFDLVYDASTTLLETSLKKHEQDFYYDFVENELRVYIPETNLLDFYVKSPGFITMIANQHELNVDHDNYIQANDNGAVLTSASLDFAGIKKVIIQEDTSKKIEETAEVALDYIVGELIGLLDLGVVDFAYSTVSTILDIYEIWDDEEDVETMTYSQSSEYIFNYENKVSQEKYVKDFIFKMHENFYMTDHVTLTTRFSDDYIPSKLISSAQFQVYVESPEQDIVPFMEGTPLIIFQNINVLNYFYETDKLSSTHILPGEKQVFEFTPLITDKYKLVGETANLQLKVFREYGGVKFEADDYDIYPCQSELFIGSNEVISNTTEFTLAVGETYYIEITNQGEEIFNLPLQFTFDKQNVQLGSNQINVEGLSRIYLVLDFTDEYNYVVSTTTNGVTLYLYDAYFNVLGNANGYPNSYESSIKYNGSSGLVYVKAVVNDNSLTTLSLTVDKTRTIKYCTYFYGYFIDDYISINDDYSNLAQAQYYGYIFEGWYIDVDYNVLLTDDYLITCGKSEIILYAKWRGDNSIVYNITYVTNGASGFEGGITPPSSYTCDDKNIVLPKPIKEHYNFMGWFEDAEFSGDAVKEVICEEMGDRTYYAKWEAVMYEIIFISDGRYQAYEDRPTFAYGTQITLPELATANGEYEVYAWSGNCVNSPYTVTGNVTLQAEWIRVKRSIIYNNIVWDGQVATLHNAPTLAYCNTTVDLTNVTASIPPIDPYSPCLVFIGWSNGLGTVLVQDVYVGNEDVNVYARWRYDLEYYYRSTELTVNDSGVLNQGHDAIYIGLTTSLCEQLKSIGIKNIIIRFNLTLKEEDDGKQEVYVYKVGSEDGVLTETQEGSFVCEYNGFSLFGTGNWGKYSNEFMEVNIDIDNCHDVYWIYIRYGASGNFEDDWVNKDVYVEISGTVEPDDAEAKEFSQNYYNPYD